MSTLDPAATSVLASLPLAIQIHMAGAVLALGLGPVALWSRKGSPLHRAIGYTWLMAMALAASSAIFIRDYNLPNVAGFSPIHLLVPYTAIFLVRGIRAAMNHRIEEHRRTMRRLYISASVVAGLFTLLPQRTLGNLLWHQTLGLV